MLILYSPVTAQDGGRDEPYYIVQEGESLWEVAARGLRHRADRRYESCPDQARSRLAFTSHCDGTSLADARSEELLRKEEDLVGPGNAVARSTAGGARTGHHRRRGQPDGAQHQARRYRQH